MGRFETELVPLFYIKTRAPAEAIHLSPAAKSKVVRNEENVRHVSAPIWAEIPSSLNLHMKAFGKYLGLLANCAVSPPYLFVSHRAALLEI